MTREVPMWLEGSSPEELRALMLANNAAHGKQFHYFDFQVVRGKWYCWFELSLSDQIDKDKNGS